MTIAERGDITLDYTLRAYLDAVRIEPADDLIQVGDRILEAANLTSLRAELSTVLYDLWHAGTVERGAKRVISRRDAELERELTAATPQRVTAVRGTVGTLAYGDDAEHGVVEVNRVRVLVPADTVSGKAPGDTVVLDLPAVRPMLSPGFFFAVGTAGGTGGGAVLRFYVHLDAAEYAPGAWHTVLDLLESRGARYRAKVLSRSDAYPRRDAIVVYLPEESWRHVPDLAHALGAAAGLGTATSALAHRIGPGLAMAWEPADDRPGWRRMSFGQHRCMAVARGVVRHVSDDVPLYQAVAEELTAAGADPAQPARNLDSPDFPAAEPIGPARLAAVSM